MQTKQTCKECGKVFMRSLYHPQITTCPECKGKTQKHCIYCKNSHKKEWMLWCSIKNKDVTDGINCQCKDFVEEKYSLAERKEIRETLEMVGGKKWI